MFEVRRTETFTIWLVGLKDRVAQKKILARIARIEVGNFGDVKSVSGRVSELRIDHGPGYRVYFTRVGKTVILLLVGGDKGSQQRDIEKAQEMAAALE